ncbi:MAG: InlB B-repeat-containing protein [Candidatus Izemoplasmatales bacterium]
MKKWAFLFMFLFISLFIMGCSGNLSSTTAEEISTTTITTMGGTISENTIYVVEFNSKGAVDIDDLGIEEGNKIDEPVVTKEGYTLSGWFLSNDSGITFIKKWDFSNDLVTQNIILYAIWDVNQYSISFESNGGSLLETLVLDYNTEIILQETPVKENFSFDGWYINE